MRLRRHVWNTRSQNSPRMESIDFTDVQQGTVSAADDQARVKDDTS